MYFTQEDYKKIENWLHRNSVKDTEFQEALPFTGKEIVTIVQDGYNRKVNIQEFVNQLYKHGVEDFLNITNTYKANNITLKEAIRLIPSEARKEGQVITFLNTDGNWEIYQFIGELNQWNNPTLWNNPFDWENLIVDSILPDEEDLTKSAPDAKGNAYLSLKDRKYEPDKYSGLGRKILRRRVVEIEDPIYGTQEKNLLLQSDFAEDNTVYIVRYDFTLNGQDITLPDNSYLEYEGGSISDGNIVDRAGGLNRIILRKNIVNGKNVLTQEMISKPNTIYEIKYDFDLNGEKIIIPYGCVLHFNGGNMHDGDIRFDNTIISSDYSAFNNITVEGNVLNNQIYSDWFINSEDFSENLISIVKLANNSNKPIIFGAGKVYNLSNRASKVKFRTSVDFNNSTLVFNVTKEDFYLLFGNNSVKTLDKSAYESILKELNGDSPTLSGFKDCMLWIQSNEAENFRNHNLSTSPTSKQEIIYVDKDGYIFNDKYNDVINSASVIYYMDCNSSMQVKNLNIEINDNFEGPQTQAYRSIGYRVEYASNILFDNINFKCDIQDFRCKYFIHDYVYNLTINNFRSNQTRLDVSTPILNDTSNYVFNFARIINLFLNNIVVSAPNKGWTHMGGNYIVNGHMYNCYVNCWDTHYRVNNLDVDHCTFASAVAVTGFGKVNITNCTFLESDMILANNRTYGAFFDGDIYINNIYITCSKGYVKLIRGGLDGFDHQHASEKGLHLSGNTIYLGNIKINTKNSGLTAYCLSLLCSAPQYEALLGEGKYLLPNKIVCENIYCDTGLQFLETTNTLPYYINKNQILDINFKNIYREKGSIDYQFLNLNNAGDSYKEDYNNSKDFSPKINLKIENSGKLMLYCPIHNVNFYIQDSEIYKFVDGKSANYRIHDCIFKLIQGTVQSASEYIINGCVFDLNTDSKETSYSYGVGKGNIFYSNKSNVVLSGCKMTNELRDFLHIKHNQIKDTIEREIGYVSNTEADAIVDIDEYINSYDIIEVYYNTNTTLKFSSTSKSQKYVYLKLLTQGNYNLKIQVDDKIIYTAGGNSEPLLVIRIYGSSSKVLDLSSPIAGDRSKLYTSKAPNGSIFYQKYNEDRVQLISTVDGKNFNYLGLNPHVVIGTTNERPDLSKDTIDPIGYQYYDTTLKKPIWWNGSNWIDSSGQQV